MPDLCERFSEFCVSAVECALAQEFAQEQAEAGSANGQVPQGFHEVD